MPVPVSRRIVLTGLAALGLGLPARAEAVVDLDWNDLLPKDGNILQQALRGFVQHNQINPDMTQPASTGVRSDWNGKTVRLPGFMVPLDYTADGVSSFILVPYMGACIHVPPPPANQLVLVSSDTPYPIEDLFEAVTVTGLFGTAGTTTELAEIGYAMTADSIDPYQP